MPKQPKAIMGLLQQKQHHEHKAAMHHARFIHHAARAREVTEKLNAMAEARRKEREQ